MALRELNHVNLSGQFNGLAKVSTAEKREA